jgi:Domain of unknown function (DUF6362)
MSRRLAKAVTIAASSPSNCALPRPARSARMAGTQTVWTPKLVAERLEEAVDVLARLPLPRVPGLYSLWPAMPHAAAGDRALIRPAAPTPEAIDRMDEVLGWLMWLDSEERQLVWLRAEGMPWKWITRRLGIGRTTAWQRSTIALLKITTRLNAAAEQDRPNIKPLNRSPDPVLESS